MASSRPAFRFYVDWNNDGLFTGTYDEVTATPGGNALAGDGMTIAYGRDQARAFSPVRAGEAAFRLNNAARIYSPENASSPLYGNLVPGRPVKITATQDAATTTIYRGFLDNYTVSPNKGDRAVTMSCLDLMARFAQANPLSTPLYASIRTGTAIGYILDALGWPSGARDLDPGASTIRWWWEEGTDGLTALARMLAAEGPPAICFVDTAGNFVYRDRHHRLLDAASVTSQATFTNGTLTESDAGTALNANPTFEAGIASWTAQNSATLASSSAQAHGGTKSMSVTPNGVASGPGALSDQVPAGPGPLYTGTAWFWSASSWATGVRVQLNWYNAAHTYLSTTTPAAVPLSAATWTQATVADTAPANAAYVQLVVSASGTPGAGQVFFTDDAQLITAGFATYSQPMTYDTGWRDIVNTIITSVDQRNQQGLAVVWQTDATIAVPAGTSVTVIAQSGDPFLNAVTPVAGTDYTLLAGAATASLSRTSGQSTTITLTDSGAGSIVTGLQLRANPVTVARTVQVSVTDTASQAAYGRRGLPSGIDISGATVEDTVAVATIFVTRYAQRKPIVTIPVANLNGTRLTQQLARDLSDRIHVTDTETGLDADFFIEQISHATSGHGRVLTTTFGCEKADATSPANVFVFDDAANGKFDTGRFGT